MGALESGPIPDSQALRAEVAGRRAQIQVGLQGEGWRQRWRRAV
jgi:hypothetical protein